LRVGVNPILNLIPNYILILSFILIPNLIPAPILTCSDHKSYAPARAQIASIIENIIGKNPTLWSAWKTRSLRSLRADDDKVYSDNNNESNNDTDKSAGYNSDSLKTDKNKEQIKESTERSFIADNFDLIVFDLDDTLVPVFNPIKPATEALTVYMEKHMPLTAVEVS
jgi:hypothetical protein